MTDDPACNISVMTEEVQDLTRVDQTFKIVLTL